jgi:RNA polymerase sigma factor (sigma-70 family)
MGATTWEVSSEDGFMGCYRATFPEVFRYTALLCGGDRAAAEDAVQDVYLAAMAKARDGSLTQLSIGYFITAARHRVVDRIRSDRREQQRLTLVASMPAAESASQTMPARLADLPERERIALVLRFVDDLSIDQVGRALGISTHAAESLVARATRRLRHQEARDA